MIERFDLAKRSVPFHRCLRCSHLLEAVAREDVRERLEPLSRLDFDGFQICPACKQIYWEGSHYERMARLVEQNRGNDHLPDR